MKETTNSFCNKDGTEIFYYIWEPDENVEIKAIVQIAHGMGEHAARYREFAEKLTLAGYTVFANDHEGHGKTARSKEDLGLIKENGFFRMVQTIRELTNRMKESHPNLPIFLIGHSMGSHLAQQYISNFGSELQGVILSGTGFNRGLLAKLGLHLARHEVKKRGFNARSQFMSNLVFGQFNRAFKPNRTTLDWLSRDETVVDRQMNDPYCGMSFNAGFWRELLQGVESTQSRMTMQHIPKTLPIYLFSGDRDPLGQFGKGIRRLAATYQSLGIQDVTFQLYSGGRHEMINELNRNEVIKDTIHWLDTHL
jgi:alpha-beta hydrolase superfamily lysophospholipase